MYWYSITEMIHRRQWTFPQILILVRVLLILIPSITSTTITTYQPFVFQSNYQNGDTLADALLFDESRDLLYITGETYTNFMEDSSQQQGIPRIPMVDMYNADCFLGALKVPSNDDTEQQQVIQKRLKLIYANNFGIKQNTEICSAMTLLRRRNKNNALQLENNQNRNNKFDLIVAGYNVSSQHPPLDNNNNNNNNKNNVEGFLLNLKSRKSSSKVFSNTHQKVILNSLLHSDDDGANNGDNNMEEVKVEYPMAITSNNQKSDDDELDSFAVYVASLTSSISSSSATYIRPISHYMDKDKYHLDRTISNGGGVGGIGGVGVRGVWFDDQWNITIRKIVKTRRSGNNNNNNNNNNMKVKWRMDNITDYFGSLSDNRVFRLADLLHVPHHIRKKDKENESEKDDLLIVVGSISENDGTTRSSNNYNTTTGNSMSDGFVLKLNPRNGHGKNEFSTFIGIPNSMDEIHGACFQRNSTNVDFIYLVGSTKSKLDGTMKSDHLTKSTSSSSILEGGYARHAFLSKLHLDTMTVRWTKQLGSMNGGDVYGYGCEITSDGEDIYLAGTIAEDDSIKLFSITNSTTTTIESNGGTDVFVAQLSVVSGNIKYVKQFGTNENDSLARGNGITSDSNGNAIVLGNTQGRLVTVEDEKDSGSTSNKSKQKSDSINIFVVSIDRQTGQMSSSILNSNNDNDKKSTSSTSLFDIIGLIVTILLGIILVFVGGYSICVFYQNRNNSVKRYLDKYGNNDINLHLRKSAAGGCHGIYDFDISLDGSSNDESLPGEVTLSFETVQVGMIIGGDNNGHDDEDNTDFSVDDSNDDDSYENNGIDDYNDSSTLDQISNKHTGDIDVLLETNQSVATQSPSTQLVLNSSELSSVSSNEREII